MAWQKLSARANVRSDKPTIGVMKNGRITWNKATQEALGEPSGVVVLFDPEEKRLAIQKVDNGEPGEFFQVTKAKNQASWSVSALGALRVAGIEVNKAFRGAAKDYGSGAWGIDVSELLEGGK